MSTMALKILKLVHSPKTKKSQYVENETFILQIKKAVYTMGSNMIKSSFLAEMITKVNT